MALRNACLGLVFAGSIVLGRAWRIDQSDISLIWPAAAISAIWMLSARSAAETVVAALSLVATGLVATFLSGADLSISIGFAFVNLVMGWGTAALLRRHGGARLEEPTDLAWLLVSVATATGAAALMGGTILHVLSDDPWLSSTLIFWMRNGVTTFLGLALLATYPRLLASLGLPPLRRLLGDLAVWVFAVSVYAFVFVVNVGAPVAYFALPVGVLIGLRWSTAVGVWHMLASGVFVLLATTANRGPFVNADPVLTAALAQGLIGCALLVVLTAALFRDSREHLLRKLERSHQQTQAAVERLHHSALHDPLTGLANRQRLMQVLDAEIAGARTSQTRVGVIFLDLNGFKAVNDNHGHAEGDLMLDAVATRLRMLLRRGDIVARPGGDEFVMVCPNLHGPAELEIVAERLAIVLARPYDLISGTRHSHVSASLGTALSTPTTTADHLIREADTAMYTAKRSHHTAARPGVHPAPPGAYPTTSAWQMS